MKEEETKLLRKKLAKLIKTAEAEILELEELTKPISPENSIGRISRMDAINNKSVAEAALRSKRQKLGKMKLAVTKIDQSDFGICERCQKPIPVARMIYMPESTRCVNCADR